MFDNLDKYILWNLSSNSVKAEDDSTTKFLYEGEERGQAQRYFIGLGDIVETLFSKITESFYSRDIFVIDSSFFKFFQALFNVNFIKLTAFNEDLIRNILENIVPLWRLKGTFFMLRFIIYKVFGWELLNISTLANTVFILNNQESEFFNPVIAEENNKLIYDPNYMSPDDKTVLYIDVKLDPNFYDKYGSLELILKEWSYNCTVEYTNTPDYFTTFYSWAHITNLDGNNLYDSSIPEENNKIIYDPSVPI